MKIMVDLDRTIFDCPSLVYNIGNMTFADSNLDRKLKFTIVDNESSRSYSNLLFFLKMSHAKNFTPVDNVVEILNKWYGQGIDVTFVSSRFGFKSFHRSTIEWLENYDIKYDKVVLDCNNKGEYGRINGFDMIIDDTLVNCVDCMKMGITPIWIRNKYNKNIKCYPENILQVSGWNEIDDIVQTRLMKEKLL